MQILSKLLYYLIIYPISKLPFGVLYIISNSFYYLIFYVFPYRKKVVKQNLQIAFPQLNEHEINLICKKFYKHFCDIVVETIKVFSIDEETLHKHLHIVNPEYLIKYHNQNKSVILVTGHYANWEWAALAFTGKTNFKTMGIFKPLSNNFFNQLLISSRGKFGCELCAPKQVGVFIENHKEQQYAYGFIADQNPSNVSKGHWMEFFGKQVPVNFGLEKYAKKYDMPVVFGKILKQKRGYYTMEYIELTDAPNSFKDGKICEMFMKFLEQIIKEEPQYWLWTHKRWKHSPKENKLSEF